jgi:hypothetical protein
MHHQSLSMRLWLAGLAHDEHLNPKAAQVIIELMRNWLQEINDSSIAEGFGFCLLDVAIGNLDDELEIARGRVTNQAVMRGQNASMTT